MFCTNCGKQVPEDGSFCEFCGTKISSEEQEEKMIDAQEPKEAMQTTEKKNDTANIKNEKLKEMASHLEFLGYQIEWEENEQNRDLITATHLTNNNFLFFEILPDHVLFKAGLRVDKKPSQAMDVAINQINKILLISRVYYDTDGKTLEIIRIEATYQGEYNKEKFSRFHEIFVKDQQLMIQVEEFKAFLKD